ncbi:hypothetical protein NQZ68_026059 [Dissostichus eleginoides]|nr:hypothetical protein NQZ68_026059 [Dissostichus eleginoides]
MFRCDRQEGEEGGGGRRGGTAYSADQPHRDPLTYRPERPSIRHNSFREAVGDGMRGKSDADLRCSAGYARH